MIEFLLPAFLGGWILCTVTGPLGCFIVWRRMAYFGDTLAHSALLGLTLGLLLDVRPSFAITFGCVGIALLLVLLQQQKQIATDTLLGILAHSGLSIGLITLSFYRDGNFDLMTFLFGDLLTLGWNEALWMLGGALVVLMLLAWIWSDLLLVTLHEDLAAAEGMQVGRVRLIFMLMLSLVIALSMKVVGVLLITSLLIIPAASARPFARGPIHMALLASLMGGLSITAGLAASWLWDTPAGPSVVTAAFILFVTSLIWQLIHTRFLAREPGVADA
ncbi:MAG: metal ABC transporter permease [Hahellaceae bacterium]|nr:metal ABC transporter permease [Hahellaceae bacterium]